jgi:hypothetical protein
MSHCFINRVMLWCGALCAHSTSECRGTRSGECLYEARIVLTQDIFTTSPCDPARWRAHEPHRFPGMDSGQNNAETVDHRARL